MQFDQMKKKVNINKSYAIVKQTDHPFYFHAINIIKLV